MAARPSFRFCSRRRMRVSLHPQLASVGFQFVECPGDRAKVHFQRRLARDRIHGNSTANHSEIERTAGPPYARRAEDVYRARDGLHRVRPSEIGPTVAAGTTQPDTESPASQGLMRDPLDTGSIDSNEFAFAATPWRFAEQMPDASKIPFPLFTDIQPQSQGGVDIAPFAARRARSTRQCPRRCLKYQQNSIRPLRSSWSGVDAGKTVSR